MDGEGSYSSSGVNNRRLRVAGGSNHEREPQNCYCGIPWISRTSNTEANPGRRFRRCRFSSADGGCKFFEWMDVESCGRCREIIPGLLRKITKLEDQLMLYEENEHLQANQDLGKVHGCDCGHIWYVMDMALVLPLLMECIFGTICGTVCGTGFGVCTTKVVNGMYFSDNMAMHY
ncbi:hypothetical protein CsatB_007919 [Cannabis sativa]